MTLVLHCGGNKVTLEDVQKVKTPPPTSTWYPVDHGKLLDLVRQNLAISGLEVEAEDHGLSGNGSEYFGTMNLKQIDAGKDYRLVVGIRNSHSKRFPCGLLAGSRVFVCDNLAFSAEVKLARKHTRNIIRDLPNLVARGMGLLGDLRNKQDQRFISYKTKEVSDSQANDFIIRCLDNNILPATKIPAALKEWREPRHPEFKAAGKTGWVLWNALTETLKCSPDLLPKRTQALAGLMDLFCGLSS